MSERLHDSTYEEARLIHKVMEYLSDSVQDSLYDIVGTGFANPGRTQIVFTAVLAQRTVGLMKGVLESLTDMRLNGDSLYGFGYDAWGRFDEKVRYSVNQLGEGGFRLCREEMNSDDQWLLTEDVSLLTKDNFHFVADTYSSKSLKGELKGRFEFDVIN